MTAFAIVASSTAAAAVANTAARLPRPGLLQSLPPPLRQPEIL